ncbi:phosphodiester glycosidase family protein [Sphingomonas canadensis]|uniref:Phosphodiester glycosidase family protein n=1 Tax=Sphingomonas canadensis TaxID=1219257 RepID=A0ABW3HCV7_9SPHN|nr:phosphodiester glycosidase family protein [Sphingomonas canadensis]MCW3837749.1 phosphodiester glycosidase family protein [Sphingomonas canadensis]
MKGFRCLAVLALALLAAGCGPPKSRDGIDAACSRITFEEGRFTVCRADPGKHELLLADKGADGKPMREFAALRGRLGPRAARVAFAMNAGMFNEQGNPIGYYVEDGAQQVALNRRKGPGNFHLEPNGVFWGDAAGWHVATTDAFAANTPAHVRFGTQSGPMLMIGGKLHPQLSENGTSLQIRNGVGVAKDGSAWFAISDEPVSFGRFARLFRDRLGCPDALYFDGAVSRLWDPVAAREDEGQPIGPIVVALQKR